MIYIINVGGYFFGDASPFAGKLHIGNLNNGRQRISLYLSVFGFEPSIDMFDTVDALNSSGIRLRLS